MWGVEEWKAFGTVLSGAATALGVAGGAWYFLVQNRRGSHMPNLSISLSCERRQSEEDGADWLAITATLKKLDRGTLGLSFARAEISEGVNRRESALWGVGLVAREGLPLYHAIKRGGKETNDLDWESDHAEPLNLTPGEETQISALCQVRANAAYQVKVVIVAFQYGFQRFGQWQASAVSLPRERERESARPPWVHPNSNTKPRRSGSEL